MKSIMERSPHDISFSRRHLNWITKRVSSHNTEEEEEEESSVSTTSHNNYTAKPITFLSAAKAKIFAKLHSVFSRNGHAKDKVTGTLFGYRKGNINFAFQMNSNPNSTIVIELAMGTRTFVKEMASGLVRIALECEREHGACNNNNGGRLVEEKVWRGYCNGRRCGYAMRRGVCENDRVKVLSKVGMVTSGAGVFETEDGEVVYMRGKFERIVGSRDSEAFYMMNPDGCFGPELSVYLLRV